MGRLWLNRPGLPPAEAADPCAFWLILFGPRAGVSVCSLCTGVWKPSLGWGLQQGPWPLTQSLIIRHPGGE